MAMKRTYSQADLKGKRPQKKRAYLAKPLTLAQTQEVKRIVLSQAENKYSIYSASLSPGFSGVAITMHPTVQGTGDQNYLGQTITPVSLTLRYGVLAATADVTNFVRVSIIQWKGIPPAAGIPSQVYDVGPLGTTLQPFNGFNPRTFDSFTVLYDKTTAVSAQGPACVCEKAHIKRKLRPIRYSDGAGTTSDGAIYFLYSSDSGVIPYPTLNFQMYTWFKDS